MNESDILQRYADEVQPVTGWPSFGPLCVWQNHTIAWLQERYSYVSIEWDGTASQWLVMAGFYVPKGDDTGNVQLKADCHDKNIHLALIAAVKATKEK